MGYIQQVIEGRYVDKEKLMNLLNKQFGKGNFHVRIQLNRWILAIPSVLSEEQIDACYPG